MDFDDDISRIRWNLALDLGVLSDAVYDAYKLQALLRSQN